MNFKELRQRVNLTVPQAAKKLKISKIMLYKIEQGTRKPSTDLIKKMTDVYGCSYEDIFISIDSTLSN